MDCTWVAGETVCTDRLHKADAYGNEINSCLCLDEQITDVITGLCTTLQHNTPKTLSFYGMKLNLIINWCMNSTTKLNNLKTKIEMPGLATPFVHPVKISIIDGTVVVTER